MQEQRDWISRLGERGAAVRAAPRGNGNFAQALGTFFRGRVRRRFTVRAGDERVDRQHHQVIDRCGDDHERHRCVQEVTVKEFAVVYCEAERGKIGPSDHRSDQGRHHVLYEGRDHRTERRSHHHANSKVNHVSAQQKLLKSTSHFCVSTTAYWTFSISLPFWNAISQKMTFVPNWRTSSRTSALRSLSL